MLLSPPMEYPVQPPVQVGTKSREVLTVSQLNRRAKQLLETHLNSIWIEGEISNFSAPSSGHWYLTLKDEQAQVRCAMFRNRNQRLRFRPENGMHVVVRGAVSLYEGRGDYQVIVEHMEELGDGALQKAFEDLKQKLFLEGLFDQQFKQPIPTLAKHIGVITSATGAAIHDILTVLKRRFPAIPVTLLPVAVQGKEAAPQIVRAIEKANALDLFDVLILGRGGGSLEDLWPFNEEVVARAIFASKLPIVSAVGHEVDITIADFVADVRAATPSAAAELLSPNRQEWFDLFLSLEKLLVKAMKRKLEIVQQQVIWLSKRVKHPGSRLQEQAQRLDELELRLKNSMQQRLVIDKMQLRRVQEQLKQHTPLQKITNLALQLDHLQKNLRAAVTQSVELKKQRLYSATQLLDTVSPLATLNRGYAIVTSPASKKIITHTKQLQLGQSIEARLADGSFQATVNKINDPSTHH